MNTPRFVFIGLIVIYALWLIYLFITFDRIKFNDSLMRRFSFITAQQTPENKSVEAVSPRDELPVLSVFRPDDENLEYFLGKTLIASANHDDVGWAGMELLESTMDAIVNTLGLKVELDNNPAVILPIDMEDE